ncbi:30S ribosomal protein THX [Pontibacter vulgaris]|nr:30S ribosomal protein THX [Pontibacter vulgaris]
MGKGDKKSKKGKIKKGSYGNSRPHKPGKAEQLHTAQKEAAATAE